MARRRRPPRAGALADLSPLKILSQIVMLQASYYLCALIMILFTTLVAGKSFSMDLVLSWKSLRGDNTVGWTLGLCWMLVSFLEVIVLLVLVARSKLILDFALTIHFIHLVVTSVYTHGLPTNLLWWSLQACSAVLMTSLGVYACQWRELRPMSFGKQKETSAQAVEGDHDEEEVAQSAGFGRGRARDTRRDGGREYEMVPLKEEAEENV